ncbi:MAG: sterol desaturase family protein [Planctomycetes bacterium]|nr:sterol desaturase family protein [Planctomycetota bacterium]
MMAYEAWRPARGLPRVRRFWPRVLLLNALQAAVVVLAGFSWERWFKCSSLVDLSGLPLIAGALIAYFVSSFIYYWWHRARHELPLLWRIFHQLHHSPSRIQLVVSFFKHPSEFVANSILSTLIAYPVLGLTPTQAGALTGMTAAAEFFYHWNVRTPRWLGWFIQRPEMHRVHHERGRHTSNFADLPVFDLLFGTFSNPANTEVECGFAQPQEQQFGAMLLCRELHGSNQKESARRFRDLVSARNIACALLLVVALSQMLFGLVHAEGARNAAASTAAAPYPKVFCDKDGYEAFAMNFELIGEDFAGETHVVEMTPDVYKQLRGPYNRRNVYGAALAFAPRMSTEQRDAVVEYAFHSNGGLRTELGMPPLHRLTIRITPKTGVDAPGYRYIYEWDAP